MFEDFTLVHEEGKLYPRVVIDRKTHTKEVTDYFTKGNAHDDWLDYRLDLHRFAQTSRFKRGEA